ncbi:spondin domain-containing protein [Duganella vulcania]|uniref:PEP-CTERM sorting domain-containing protein n=1 Tax=Duganella vulcania TaxID=2692166 RepID=A0A845GN02_9BURK|nr:spondin domain-containing protein [Duganella vulcania]MYM94706.1 PEP-CTERM sorting domain-containing protein [Duganella vulcania]
MKSYTLAKAVLAACVGLSACAAQAADVTFTFTNTAPAGGVGVAPLWLGLHNGSFDSFDVGSAASVAIERAAEDGNASVLTSNFASQVAGGLQTTLPNGPRFPGASSTFTLHNVDLNGANRYLSYAAMVVLSNDFFIGNDNAKAIDLSSLAGGGSLSLALGGAGHVYDAGTEQNNFAYSLANGAYGIGGGQSAANQGIDEHGVVHVATGNPYLSFVDDGHYVPANFDWTALNFNNQQSIGRLDISVTAVPEPETYAMLFAGLGLLGVVARRRQGQGKVAEAAGDIA